jgi:hypothetical protein
VPNIGKSQTCDMKKISMLVLTYDCKIYEEYLVDEVGCYSCKFEEHSRIFKNIQLTQRKPISSTRDESSTRTVQTRLAALENRTGRS